MKNISVKKLHTFLGHNDSIYKLEQVDDSRFLSAGGDGMVVLWDLNTPDEGEVVAKVAGSVYAMAYDASSDLLFVAENSSGIHKIDLAKKKEIGSIQLGNHQIFDVKIFQDRVWVGLATGELIVMNKDLEVTRRDRLGKDRLRSIEFYDKQAALSFSDNKIRILDTDEMAVTQELSGHKNSVFVGKYHPSGKYLVSGGRDAQLKVWDTQASFVQRESIAAHLYTINDVVFRKDGRYFVSVSMDKSIKLWDAHNFKLLKVLDKHRHAGHGNSVNGLIWMNYQDLLVTCSDDRTISVWEINFAE